MEPSALVREQMAAPRPPETPVVMGRDSRGLYPEIVPDRAIVARIRRVDPRWRVEFDRVRGRFVLFHDHPGYAPQSLRIKEGPRGFPRSVSDPTFTVKTKAGGFQPLDERTIARVEMAAWLERKCKSAADFDAEIDRIMEEERDAAEEKVRQENLAWGQENAKHLARGLVGDYEKPTPRDPKIYSIPKRA